MSGDIGAAVSHVVDALHTSDDGASIADVIDGITRALTRKDDDGSSEDSLAELVDGIAVSIDRIATALERIAPPARAKSDEVDFEACGWVYPIATPVEADPNAPTDIAALPDYWDARRLRDGKPDKSRCGQELRRALERAQGG